MVPAVARATRDEDEIVRMLTLEMLGDAPKTPELKKIAVPALVRNANRVLFIFLKHGLILGGGNVSAPGFVVLDGFNGLAG